jgi:hypothetical protein
MKQAPKHLDPKIILWVTSCENMSNEDRRKVFEAYEYKPYHQIYELNKPELLTNEIIEKITRMDDE